MGSKELRAADVRWQPFMCGRPSPATPLEPIRVPGEASRRCVRVNPDMCYRSCSTRASNDLSAAQVESSADHNAAIQIGALPIGPDRSLSRARVMGFGVWLKRRGYTVLPEIGERLHTPFCRRRAC